jgi:hypothetical protein
MSVLLPGLPVVSGKDLIKVFFRLGFPLCHPFMAISNFLAMITMFFIRYAVPQN